MKYCLFGHRPDEFERSTCLNLWTHEEDYSEADYPPCRTGVCPMETADPPDWPDFPF